MENHHQAGEKFKKSGVPWPIAVAALAAIGSIGGSQCTTETNKRRESGLPVEATHSEALIGEVRRLEKRLETACLAQSVQRSPDFTEREDKNSFNRLRERWKGARPSGKVADASEMDAKQFLIPELAAHTQQSDLEMEESEIRLVIESFLVRSGYTPQVIPHCSDSYASTWSDLYGTWQISAYDAMSGQQTTRLKPAWGGWAWWPEEPQ